MSFFVYLQFKQAYKLSRGHVWGLITLLCGCTALISAVLVNKFYLNWKRKIYLSILIMSTYLLIHRSFGQSVH